MQTAPMESDRLRCRYAGIIFPVKNQNGRFDGFHMPESTAMPCLRRVRVHSPWRPTRQLSFKERHIGRRCEHIPVRDSSPANSRSEVEVWAGYGEIGKEATLRPAADGHFSLVDSPFRYARFEYSDNVVVVVCADATPRTACELLTMRTPTAVIGTEDRIACGNEPWSPVEARDVEAKIQPIVRASV